MIIVFCNKLLCRDAAYLLQRYIKYPRNKSKFEDFFVFLHSKIYLVIFWTRLYHFQ